VEELLERNRRRPEVIAQVRGNAIVGKNQKSEFLVRGKFPTPVDRSAVSENWRRRGYSCGLFVDPPGRCWEDFVHATNELVTVVDGRLEMEIAGTMLQVEPGDEVFIPARAVHSVRNIHTGTSRWLYGYD